MSGKERNATIREASRQLYRLYQLVKRAMSDTFSLVILQTKQNYNSKEFIIHTEGGEKDQKKRNTDTA